MPRPWLALVLLTAGGCTSISSQICSDYQSTVNCMSGNRGDFHTGIDFRGRAGSTAPLRCPD